jgi:hypothetical protein
VRGLQEIKLFILTPLGSLRSPILPQGEDN